MQVAEQSEQVRNVKGRKDSSIQSTGPKEFEWKNPRVNTMQLQAVRTPSREKETYSGCMILPVPQTKQPKFDLLLTERVEGHTR